MASVLVTRRLPTPVMERLGRECGVDLWDAEEAIPPDELLRRIRGKDAAIVLLTDKVDAEILDAAGASLRIVSNFAVGYDNVDVGECTRRGILVSNTPEVLTETTADLTFSLLLASARRIAEGDRLLRSRRHWIWGPEMMLGRDIYGKTLGVVGFGRIGQAVARRARGFGMRVVYHDPHRADLAVESELAAEHLPFERLLRESDFVTVHVALTAETRHLFSREQFRMMKPTCVLVNTSRGPVVDEDALAEALEQGEIFAAGLDVFEREPEVNPRLLVLDNVTVIPHLGSATVETRAAMGNLAVENVLAALRGVRPPTLVNPEVWEQAR